MGRLGYRPELDGIRGLAIIAVLLLHAGLIRGGFIGVDVFFVLSGFLITTLLLEEHHHSGRVDLRAFYVRRMRRLLPALGALLIAITTVYVGLGIFSLELLGRLAAGLFYVANIAHALGYVFPQELGHLWSLAQEEQFYVLWPPLLILALRRQSLRWIAGALAFAIAVAFVWRGYLTAQQGFTERVWVAPDTRADGLLVGCLVAVMRARGFLSGRGRVLQAAGLGALLGLFAQAMLMGYDVVTLYVGRPACVLAAGVLIAAVVANEDVLAARLMSLRPLVWVGAISYSVYLWHPPIFAVVPPVPVGLVLSIAIGAASYYWIEQPFRRGQFVVGWVGPKNAGWRLARRSTSTVRRVLFPG